MMRSLTLTALAVVLVIVHGLVHGWWTDRWSTSTELQARVARLEFVPETLGEWESKPHQLDAKRLEIGEIKGYLLRRYVHRQRKTAVWLLIVCGHPRSITVHTPDVCYRGAGYELVGPEQKRTIDAKDVTGEFWFGSFRRAEEATANLHIWWSWNEGNGWRAPAYPRFTFGGVKALYKLYVIREGVGAKGPEEEFLQTLLPPLERALFHDESDAK